ncbi:retrovirus-related pol polyprotein from transposon TNT 1-94 [Tanacetum coccineum]
MSNSNTNLQTQSSNALHNAIMEAGSKDRPPMLAPGNYVQWKSRIKRYIDTKPNSELIHYCLQNPPYTYQWAEKTVPVAEGSSETTTERYMENYKNVSQDIRDQLNAEAEAVQIILTGIDNDIYSTVDACPNACEMWKAIERLKQGESINVQDLETNLYWEFGKFTSRDGESLESYYSRFYKMMNELVRNQCHVTNHQVNVQFLLQLQPEWQRFVTLVKQSQELKTVSYHKLYDILKQHQNEVNEIRAERLALLQNEIEEKPLLLLRYTSYDPELLRVPEDEEMAQGKGDLKTYGFNFHLGTGYDNPRAVNVVGLGKMWVSGCANKYGIRVTTIQKVTPDQVQFWTIFDDEPIHKYSARTRQPQKDPRGVQVSRTEDQTSSSALEAFGCGSYDDDYMLMLNDEEKPVKSSSNDMELEQEPDKIDVKQGILEQQPNGLKVNTTVFEETVGVKVKEKHGLRRGLGPLKVKKKNCQRALRPNYVLRSAKDRKKKLAMALKPPFGQQLATSLVPIKRKSRIMKTEVIVLPFGYLRTATNSFNNDIMTHEPFVENLSRPDDCKSDKVTVPEQMYEFITNKALRVSVSLGQTRHCYRPPEEDWAIVSLHFSTCILSEMMPWKAVEKVLRMRSLGFSYYNLQGIWGMYHRECQEPKRVLFKNRNWEAHYMYMAQIHESLRADQEEQLIDLDQGQCGRNTSVSRPQLKSNHLEDRVMSNNSQGKKQEVEDHRRKFKFSNNKTSVTACNDSLNAKTSNVNFVCVTCGKCVLNDNHDLCVLHYINGVNSRTRQPMAVPISTREPKQNVNQSVATSSKKTVATDSTVKKSRNITRKLYEQLVEIILFIVDSGCSKHMTRNLKLLTNFVEKFLGTVKFGNDQIAPILGYGDLVQGTITIKRVYYVEGLNHNLFSVGQFCDADLEVAFRKSTCYICDLKGNDLLTGSRGTDLYSISLQDSTTPNPICLMAKATSSQAWLWHRRLSYLNFDTINLLSKNNIVNGLPKLKFIKDHLCSSCELGKAKRKSFHTKTTPRSKRQLQLLHMDLCGPIRVESINGKKYVLVIIDDYSRYTWTHFLRDGENLDKMKEKGDACIFGGYSTQFKAYRVFNTSMSNDVCSQQFRPQTSMSNDVCSQQFRPQTSMSNDVCSQQFRPQTSMSNDV